MPQPPIRHNFSFAVISEDLDEWGGVNLTGPKNESYQGQKCFLWKKRVYYRMDSCRWSHLKWKLFHWARIILVRTWRQNLVLWILGQCKTAASFFGVLHLKSFFGHIKSMLLSFHWCAYQPQIFEIRIKSVDLRKDSLKSVLTWDIFSWKMLEK